MKRYLGVYDQLAVCAQLFGLPSFVLTGRRRQG